MTLGLCALILGMDCEIKYWQTLKVQYGHIWCDDCIVCYFISHYFKFLYFRF